MTKLSARIRPGRAARLARRLSLALALVAVPSLALAAVTAKGHIQGEKTLLNPVWAKAKDPSSHRYTFRWPSATVAPEARVLSGFMPKELCIAALATKGPATKQPLRVTIIGGRTSPVTLVVAEGQQVQFENKDPFPHRIYDDKKSLPPGEVQPAKTRAWTPPGPGKYEIADELSPSLRSWIVVEPRVVAVAFPNRKGDFAIDLEPGEYVLRGYFAGEPVGAELPVTIAPGPAEQTLKAPLVVGTAQPAAGGKP